MNEAPCDLRGPWAWNEARTFLETATVPIRVAANGAGGFPVIVPLWFQWAQDHFWLAVKPSAAIAALLERDPRCAFDISVEDPPYKGVRGHGNATVVPEGFPVLEALVDRYVGEGAPNFRSWLLNRSKDESAIKIHPIKLIAWDFSGRMSR